LKKYFKFLLLYITDNFKTKFDKIEKVLKENGSNGHLVGSKLSLADISLFEILLLVEEFFGLNEFDQYPELKVIMSTVIVSNFRKIHTKQYGAVLFLENYDKFQIFSLNNA